MGAGGSTRNRSFYDSSFSNEHVAPNAEREKENPSGIDLHQIETTDQTIQRHHIPYPMNPSILSVPYHSRYPFQDYRFLKKVGGGKFSSVYKCEKNQVGTKERAAIKEITSKEMSPSQYQDIRYELSMLSQLSHENVISLIAVYEPPTIDAKLYAVYEYLKGGELFQGFISAGKYSLFAVLHACQQIVSAVHHLHSHGVIHGNIAPENIVLQTSYQQDTFLQQRTIKLVGFDFAESINGSSTKRQIQRHPEISEFTAPEQKLLLDGNSTEQFSRLLGIGKITNPRTFALMAASDVWSTFCIFYVLITGTFPMYQNKQISGQLLLSEPIWENISDTLKDDFRKSLYPLPSHRATTKEILQQRWYLQKLDTNENLEDNNLDLSRNIADLKFLQRRRRNSYSMYVASGTIKFQKPTRFQDHQVLPTMLSINP